MRRDNVGMLSSRLAWQRLRDIQQVVANQPLVAHAVRYLPLCDQLDLTLELLRQNEWPDFDQADALPPNVIPFRRR
jgi:hypothetical protein